MDVNRRTLLLSAALTLALAPRFTPAMAATPGGDLATASFSSSQAQYDALKQQAGDPPPPAWRDLPDWSGIWFADSPHPPNPPLNAAGQAIYDKTLANLAKGIEWDQLSDCLPSGFPRLLREPFEHEFFLRPDLVFMHNVNAEEARRIYTDGRAHMPQDAAYPLWEGDSVGFWDRGKLVVHTNHLRAYPQGYFRSGPPQSEQFSSVEVWRNLGPDDLQLQLTVYDPVYLTGPWRITYHYFRQAKGPIWQNRGDQWVCNENSNVTRNPDGSTHQLLPGEPGYRAPEDLLAPGTAAK